MRPGIHDSTVSGFVGWLAFERIARAGASVVVLGAMARALGPEGFGELYAALAFVQVLMPIAMLGLETRITRDLVREPDAVGDILGTALRLRVAAGGICAAFLATWSSAIGTSVGPAMLVPLGGMLLWQAGDVVDLWFRRHLDSRTTVIVRLAVTLTTAALKVGCAAAGAGPVVFAWILSAEALVFGAALIAAYRRRERERWRWDRPRAARWLRDGWGVVAGAALGSVTMRFDQLAVAEFLGPRAAGEYFAALRLAELPFFAATVVTTALLPRLAEAASDPQRYRARLTESFELAGAVAWLMLLGSLALAGPVLGLLVGDAFRSSAAVLQVHAFAALGLFTALVRAQHLSLHPSPGTYLLSAATTLAVQATAALLLIPRFGLVGAAAAFALAQLVAAVVLPTVAPALQPCLGPQWRALTLPLRPRRWLELARLLR